MAAVTSVIMGATALAGAGMNIAGGIKAKKDQRRAEAQADIALQDAKRRIEVNRMEGVQIPLDAYKLQADTLVAMGKQNIEAMQESGQRAVASGAAGLQFATEAASESARQNMADDIYKRDMSIADNQTNIDRTLANVSLSEAVGAQAAAAQADERAATMFAGAVKGVGEGAMNIYKASNLYKTQESLAAGEKALMDGAYVGGAKTASEAAKYLEGLGYSKEQLKQMAMGEMQFPVASVKDAGFNLASGIGIDAIAPGILNTN